MLEPDYTALYASKAARQLRKFPISDTLRIMQACAGLSLFNVDRVVRIVSIEEVKKRNERTY
jgi:hypothetical protein